MINWNSIPPLTALRAFSALAEAGSTQAAGALLNVSHAAISQQIKQLEDRLSLDLVDRSGKGLTLTEQGGQLAQALALGFGSIERTLAELTGADADRPLLISTTATFAANWLLPRLPAFRAQCPDANLMMNVTPETVELGHGGVDLVLRFGRGDWPGLHSELLVASGIVVVGAPELVEERDTSDLSKLADFHWLSEQGTHEASDWLRKHGVESGKARGITHLPGNMMLDAARQGQGLVSTARCFVQDDLASGRLKLLYEEIDTENDKPLGYYLAYADTVQRPVAKAFSKWIRQLAKSLSGAGSELPV